MAAKGGGKPLGKGGRVLFQTDQGLWEVVKKRSAWRVIMYTKQSPEGHEYYRRFETRKRAIYWIKTYSKPI